MLWKHCINAHYYYYRETQRWIKARNITLPMRELAIHVFSPGEHLFCSQSHCCCRRSHTACLGGQPCRATPAWRGHRPNCPSSQSQECSNGALSGSLRLVSHRWCTSSLLMLRLHAHTPASEQGANKEGSWAERRQGASAAFSPVPSKASPLRASSQHWDRRGFSERETLQLFYYCSSVDFHF